ncbi:MAG: hypothetical protein JJT93_07290 [Gammaproteobacteria bacterium]|nr:hypothetical protein [Gammaproteobacteria bacterium]TVQ50753.1 MAG: hypothetical protein EA371_00040 [Gammaproteobacteria bacterium]
MSAGRDHSTRAGERRLLQRNAVATHVYLSGRTQRPRRFKASNLSALGVFIEGADTGLETGQVVNLVFPVPVAGIVRLHRKKAVVAHVSARGAGLMMQGRLRRPRQA